MKDICSRVLEGTKIRLRPVLMTASVAALGFIPMALSNGSWSRSTRTIGNSCNRRVDNRYFSYLIVLPLLYIIFSSKIKPAMKSSVAIITVISLLALSNSAHAQQPAVKRVGVDVAISMAKSNLLYEVNNQQINRGKAQIKTATAFSKTGVFAENEDLRQVIIPGS
jgi:cobalt-zinc-cadmium resistance protein CzcA